MQALHSSSAFCVNVFQYWQQIGQVPVIASACGYCRKGNKISKQIQFEEKFPIKGIGRIPPNIDVVIHNAEESVFKRFAIECKFSEPYRSSGLKGFKSAYLEQENLRQDIPELHKLAISINPMDAINRYLDAAQLIKYILGLKSIYAKSKYKLLYLWFDVLGKEGADHQEEIDVFTEIAKSDGIHFSSFSYQALILRLAKECRDEHNAYIQYLTERYL